jgi:hypothetical protein
MKFRTCYTFSDKTPDLFVHAARRFVQSLKKEEDNNKVDIRETQCEVVN